MSRGGHGLFQFDSGLGERGLLRVLIIGDGANFQIPKTPQDVESRPQANASRRTRQRTAIIGWNRAGAGFTLGATLYERWSR